MKIGILLLLITLSCSKMTQKTIEVVSLKPAASLEMQGNSLATAQQTAVVISSDEDFSTINPKMSFGLVAVEKREYFELPQEELVQKHLIFEVVDLKKIQPNRYEFFINTTVLEPYKLVYCRFERPGFVMKEGYHSPVFELKLP